MAENQRRVDHHYEHKNNFFLLFLTQKSGLCGGQGAGCSPSTYASSCCWSTISGGALLHMVPTGSLSHLYPSRQTWRAPSLLLIPYWPEVVTWPQLTQGMLGDASFILGECGPSKHQGCCYYRERGGDLGKESLCMTFLELKENESWN